MIELLLGGGSFYSAAVTWYKSDMPHLLGGYAPYISSATVVTYPSAPPRSNHGSGGYMGAYPPLRCAWYILYLYFMMINIPFHRSCLSQNASHPVHRGTCLVSCFSPLASPQLFSFYACQCCPSQAGISIVAAEHIFELCLLYLSCH